jgi:hypothetical protein
MNLSLGFGLDKHRVQNGTLLNQFTPDPDYATILSAMATEPSPSDKVIQNQLILDLKAAGVWDKAQFLDMISADTDANSLLNWKSPGIFNPAKVGTPNFLPYAGFIGSTGNSIRLNFTPSTQSTVISQNDVCLITGVGTNTFNDVDDVGVSDGSRWIGIRSRHSDAKFYTRANAITSSSRTNANAIGHYALSRGAAGNYDTYINKVKANHAINSVGVPTAEMYGCGARISGTVYYNTKRLRYIFLFKYLTETEIGAVIDAMEAYLANYGTHLINNPANDSIDYSNTIVESFPETREEIPLTTYDGSGETIHPSVLDLGSAWNGYRYWMANTPYPGNNDDYENPSIWASNDGVTWVVPAGLTNPVVPMPATLYNADAELYFESGTMYMIWRDASDSKIKQLRSTNGITWTNLTTLFTWSISVECVSPALIKIGAKYYMYGQSAQSIGFIVRYSSNTIDGTYANPEYIVTNVVSGKVWWHLGIRYLNGAYWIAACEAPFGGIPNNIYLFKSTDGINFTRSLNPIVSNNDATFLPDFHSVYRPTIATIGSDVYMYYGRRPTAGVSKLSRIKLILH